MSTTGHQNLTGRQIRGILKVDERTGSLQGKRTAQKGRSRCILNNKELKEDEDVWSLVFYKKAAAGELGEFSFEEMAREEATLQVLRRLLGNKN